MKKKTRKIVMILLILVLLVSSGMVVSRRIQYGKGDKDYNDAAGLAQLPDLSAIQMPYETEPLEPEWVDPYADALSAMDFTALREVNDDVLGWILIPDSPISYPMVQGSNNSYYLKHTWRLTSSVVGAIFLDAQCDDDFSDFNTIIYGHRMNNGSMFAGLAKYKNYSYYKSHPTVYISDDNGSRAYQIFAAYEVSVSGDTYRLGITNEKDKQAYIDYCLSRSLYNTGVVPTVYDSIVTLSTCTGRGHATRWVVQAVIRGEAPPAGSVTEDVTEEPPAETQTPAETTTPPAVTEPPVEEVPPAETESEETVTGDGDPFVPDLDSETIPAA